MPKKLTDNIKLTIINKRNVTKGIEFIFIDLDGNTVNSSLYNKLIKDYSFNLSKKFTASSARLVFINENGLFSPDFDNAVLKKGYRLQIKAYFAEFPDQKFDQFEGVIRQINPLKTGEGNTVEVICYDALIKLQEADIQKVFESPSKEFVEKDLLTSNPLPSPRELLSQVFDGNYAGWAFLPPPTITITNKGTSETAHTNSDGFEINYKSGQVILNQVLNIEDFDVKATYYYYKQGLFGEDIIKGILLESDSFGNPLFSEDDVSSTLYEEESVMSDTLIPITTPLSLTAQLAVKKQPSDTSLYVYRFDSWKFISTHKLKIGDTELTWNGKEDVIIGGIEMTKLTNVSGSHDEDILRGEPATIYYDIGNNITTRAWKTTYNNITTDISNSDFEVSGASVESFDTRTGILLLDTLIGKDQSIVLNTNYTFYTLQSTGIEIPYLRLSRSQHANRLDAIKKEILSLLPPNYVLFTRGTSKIWGMFLTQKPAGREDFELKLNKQIQYITDQDVYSRVFLRGRNNNPHNIMLDDSTTLLGLNEYSLAFNSFATDQPIRVPYEGSFSRDYYPFTIYRMPGQRWSWVTDKVLIYSSWVEDGVVKTPTIKIDGVPVGHEVHQKSRIPITLNAKTKREGRKAIGLIFGEWEIDPGKEVVDYYELRLPHRALVPPQLDNPKTHIVFYDRDGKVLEHHSEPLIVKTSNTTNMDVHSFDLLHINTYHPEGEYIGKVYPAEDFTIVRLKFSNWYVARFGFITYSIIVPETIDGKPSWYMSGVYFWVHKMLLQQQAFHGGAEPPEGVDVMQTHFFSGDGGSTKVAIYSQLTASFKYRSILAQFDEPLNLKDGDPNTETQLAFFFETAIGGQPAFIIDFNKNIKVQAIDIIGGKWYPYKELDKGFAMDCEYTLTLQASNSPGYASLTSDAGPSSSTLYVLEGQTANFPESGMAFLGDDSFTYTGKTNNSFTGVSGLSENHDVYYGWEEDPETGASHRQYRRILILTEPFSNISSEASNIAIKSGDTISLDKSQLGETFECRMIRAIVDHVEPVEYARRTFAYPVSIASFNVYEDVEFEADAKLSPTTELTQGFSSPPSTLQVKDTSLFAASGTAYLGTEQFFYTGKTSTSFTGISGLAEGHFTGAYVTQENVWDDNSLFVRDPNNLLKEIGDRVFKERGVNQKMTTQEDLNKRAREFLSEFYKNHTKVRIENVFAPYAYIGQTALLIDIYSENFEIDRNYFIESIMCRNGNYSIEMAYYP